MKTLTRERASATQAASRGFDPSHLPDVLSSVQANVMVADLGLNLVYVNETAMRTLRTIERHIVDAFGITVDHLLNGSIHRFHKDPGRIERILHDQAHLPQPVSGRPDAAILEMKDLGENVFYGG